MFGFDLATAGLWPIIWHYGLALGMMAPFIVIAVMVPSLRALALVVVALIAVAVVSALIGGHLEAQRYRAQQKVIDDQVDSVAKSVQSLEAKHMKDRWDDPRN